MNKKHKLLKNIEEFKTITQKRLTERGKFPYDTVHSTFEIKDENFIMERLKSSGLSMGKPVDYMGVNGIPIYTKTLSIDNKFAFENNSKDSSYSSNINISEDKIKENDQKILDLIVKSGANNQNLTDEEKVIAFTKYIGEITNYDNEAYRARNVDTEYYRASDLFSVTERKLAMCVGYSVTAARAFNIMGIPSYVVSGKSPQGISHAAVRAYYNRSWHIIDITASTYWKNGNYKTTYSDFIKEYCIDGYDVYDPAKTNNRFKVKYMESNEAFENWIHNNGSKSMLFINESAALKDKKPKDDFVPVPVTEKEKNELIDKYKKLLSQIPENTQNPGEKNIRDYLKNEYEEILKKDNLFEHEHAEFKESLNLNESFYLQLKKEEMKPSDNLKKEEKPRENSVKERETPAENNDFVSVTEKNNLIDKYKELLSKIPENTQNPGEKNIRNYLEKEYEELLQKDKLFKHEYTEFTKSLNLNETFYSQLKEGEMKLSENPEKGETNTN